MTHSDFLEIAEDGLRLYECVNEDELRPVAGIRREHLVSVGTNMENDQVKERIEVSKAESARLAQRLRASVRRGAKPDPAPATGGRSET